MMTVFTFICLFPVMLARDFTPSNELRYLSIANEALADGHIFAFYNHGLAYADKPPLYFWIVMLCRLLFGHHSCLALSMFSLIPAFVITGIMDKWVMKGKSAMDRMALAGMTLTCVMFLGTMIVLRMDMLMCMFIVLALWTFYRMYTGEVARKSDSVLLPVWIFLALFTKGPVGLLMPPLSIAVFLAVKRDWKEFGKYLGLKTWGHHRRACGPLDRLCLDRGRIGVHQQPFGKTDRRAGRQRLHPRQAVLVLSRGYYLVSGTVQPAVDRIVHSLFTAGQEDRS